MKIIEVYFASSWKHADTVKKLTDQLRFYGFNVYSWLENSGTEDPNKEAFSLEEWLQTQDSVRCFQYDLESIKRVQLLIYIGASGIDAWAEVGFAAGRGNCEIWALWGCNEKVGIMRKLINRLFRTETELLTAAKSLLKQNGNTKQLELANLMRAGQ